MKNITNVAVLGSTGYTGLELIYILSKHPNVLLKFLGSESYAGKSINTLDSRFIDENLPKLDYIKNIDFKEVDIVFLALPHTISQKIVMDNFGKCIFIDLSADFRLDDLNEYKNNYNKDHLCPSYLKNFVYGLPEINYEKIKKSENVAVPGCYPTSILLPLIPLIENNLILSNNIIIDSKSGYSGAGKKFDTAKLFNNEKQNFYNYNTNNHRHICEIYQELKKISLLEIKFSFNPHILPIFRGLMSTIYCDLNDNVSKEDIVNSYLNKYSNNFFMKIVKENIAADFFSIINTNNCFIKLFDHFDNNKIIIVCLIDNLLKGASGQAVQCMNIILNLEEKTGLIV